MFKKLLPLAFAGLMAMGSAFTPAQASEEAAAEEHGTPHYPMVKPVRQTWSFAGPFGRYDKAELQRGLKVYVEVCSACHSMDKVAFRTLEDLGYSEEQVKALAANYTVTDGPNADGEMFERPAIPSDYFPSPFPNVEAAAAANNGAAPPDFSLIAKARAVERGLPWFILDIFTMYAENGPDYIYGLLTGYSEDVPHGIEIQEGTYYNPHFNGGPALSMAPPLSDDLVTFDDGSPSTISAQAHDVAAFLMWAAEPKLEQRKKTGFRVLVFMALFAGMVYLLKRRVFANVAH